jgi:hypothetical protein
MPLIHHPRPKGHVISFSGGMQGELHKTLSGPSCQENPVYEAPVNNHDRMNAMGRVMGGSCRRPCVYDHFLKIMVIWKGGLGDARAGSRVNRGPTLMEPSGEPTTPTPKT